MRVDKEQKEINLLRKSVGLKPVKVKERKCLSCGNVFTSYGSFNRICMKCRDYQKEGE